MVSRRTSSSGRCESVRHLLSLRPRRSPTREATSTRAAPPSRMDASLSAHRSCPAALGSAPVALRADDASGAWCGTQPLRVVHNHGDAAERRWRRTADRDHTTDRSEAGCDSDRRVRVDTRPKPRHPMPFSGHGAPAVMILTASERPSLCRRLQKVRGCSPGPSLILSLGGSTPTAQSRPSSRLVNGEVAGTAVALFTVYARDLMPADRSGSSRSGSSTVGIFTGARFEGAGERRSGRSSAWRTKQPRSGSSTAWRIKKPRSESSGRDRPDC